MFEIQSMFFLNSPQHFLPSKPLENQSKPFDGRKNQIMWKKRPDGKNANLLLFFTVDVLKIGSFLVYNISRAELSQAPPPWVKSSWVKLSWEKPRWAESSCVKPRWVNYLSLYLCNIEKRQVYYGKNAHLNSNPEFPIALLRFPHFFELERDSWSYSNNCHLLTYFPARITYMHKGTRRTLLFPAQQLVMGRSEKRFLGTWTCNLLKNGVLRRQAWTRILNHFLPIYFVYYLVYSLVIVSYSKYTSNLLNLAWHCSTKSRFIHSITILVSWMKIQSRK